LHFFLSNPLATDRENEVYLRRHFECLFLEKSTEKKNTEGTEKKTLLPSHISPLLVGLSSLDSLLS